VIKKDGAEETLDDAVEVTAALGVLGGEAKHAILVDLRPAKSVAPAARWHYVGSDRPRREMALALLVGSALSRVIGNFALAASRGRLPMRLFTSQVEAIQWLRGFLRRA
jgi:hypothetical protein